MGRMGRVRDRMAHAAAPAAMGATIFPDALWRSRAAPGKMVGPRRPWRGPSPAH